METKKITHKKLYVFFFLGWRHRILNLGMKVKCVQQEIHLQNPENLSTITATSNEKFQPKIRILRRLSVKLTKIPAYHHPKQGVQPSKTKFSYRIYLQCR